MALSHHAGAMTQRFSHGLDWWDCWGREQLNSQTSQGQDLRPDHRIVQEALKSLRFNPHVHGAFGHRPPPALKTRPSGRSSPTLWYGRGTAAGDKTVKFCVTGSQSSGYSTEVGSVNWSGLLCTSQSLDMVR